MIIEKSDICNFADENTFGERLIEIKENLVSDTIKVEASDDILLLGITIDKKLTFKQHIENLCRKAQYKLHALRCIRKFLTVEKAKILGNAFIDSQFN